MRKRVPRQISWRGGFFRCFFEHSYIFFAHTLFGIQHLNDSKNLNSNPDFKISTIIEVVWHVLRSPRRPGFFTVDLGVHNFRT